MREQHWDAHGKGAENWLQFLEWKVLCGWRKKLEEGEGHGFPRGAVHTLQLILQTLLENGPAGFNKGWRKSQH